jgi:hypothetical protein
MGCFYISFPYLEFVLDCHLADDRFFRKHPAFGLNAKVFTEIKTQERISYYEILRTSQHSLPHSLASV